MSLPVVGKAHEAKAAQESFHWFIYGSSLDREAFTAWAAQHGYRLPDFSRAVPARLDGWRLSFDVRSNFWGGTVASVTEAAGGAVEGIALPLEGSARGLVDHKEGAISGLYVPFAAEAQPLAGGAAIRVLVYRAAPERRMATEESPAPRFVDTLIKGAREFGLSEGYRKTLDALRG